MELRVTPQVFLDQAIANSQRQTELLAELQQQASTGNRLLQPSDDPAAEVNLLLAKAQDSRLGSYLGSIQSATANLNASTAALQDATGIFTAAHQIAVQGANADNSPASYETLAQQVDALLGRLLDLANSQNGGHYLFAGTASSQVPFAVTARDSTGRPLAVAYQGTNDRAVVSVSQQQTVATLYPGSQVFQQRQRATTVYDGTTGAAPGTGTDSATGRAQLLVTHILTTFSGNSGVKAGDNSATGDTVLGPAGVNSLAITDTSGTGASGTVSLNGGPRVAFTSADTNLKVSGPKGETVFLNTTSIAPGFSGAISITSTGTLSVDGGATSIPIDWSANQVVSNSATGAVTNVDSTSIRRTGTDNLTYSGTFDAFQALIALRDDLRNTRSLTGVQQAQAISQDMGELDRVQSGLSTAEGEQSASLQSLQATQNQLNQVQLDTQKRITELQAADLTQVVLGLQSQQNLLQLTLASTARLLGQSILNYLP